MLDRYRHEEHDLAMTTPDVAALCRLGFGLRRAAGVLTVNG
jgi:hypothetical protein